MASRQRNATLRPAEITRNRVDKHVSLVLVGQWPFVRPAAGKHEIRKIDVWPRLFQQAIEVELVGTKHQLQFGNDILGKLAFLYDHKQL